MRRCLAATTVPRCTTRIAGRCYSPAHMLGLFYPYGVVLQAIAILHFARRRPDSFWLWIIILGGGLGALVYIVAEVVPDLGLLRGAVQVYPRRKRIKYLEAAVIDNPSVGNFEELGDLYLDDGRFAKARECFDRVISPRTDSADPFYRRALAEIELGHHQAAADDLARTVAIDPKYRLSPRRRPPRARARSAWPDRRGGRPLCGSHTNLHAVGNSSELCVVSVRHRQDGRSPRMGAAGTCQKGDDAGLHAAARAAMVPKSSGIG